MPAHHIIVIVLKHHTTGGPHFVYVYRRASL